MRSRWFIAVPVALAMGCGNATGPTGDTLSDAETQAITEAVVGVALAEGLSFGASPMEQQAARVVPITFDFSVDETAPCALGGTVRVVGSISGSVDSQAESGSLSVDITETLSDCGIATAQHGNFTVSTDPTITLVGDLAYGPNGPTGTSSFVYEGGFAWEHEGGRAGTCPVSLELTWSATSASYSGQVCGNTYQATVNTG